MKISSKILIAMTLCLAMVQQPCRAEDIDIYGSPTSSEDKPNILIIIDNSANWAAASQHWPDDADGTSMKQGEAELRALKNVVNELNDNVRVGLMLFTPGTGSAHDGGYVRYRVRSMSATSKAALQELIGDSTCVDGANSLNNTPNCIFKNFASGANSESVGTAKTDYSAVMFEAFKYFGGHTDPAHVDNSTYTAGSPADSSHFGPMRYGGDPETKTDQCAFADGYGTFPCSSAAKTTWRPPTQGSSGCAKNYIIFIGNGFPNQDSPASLLTGVNGDATQLELPNYTSVTVVTPTLLGNTLQCYSSSVSASTADYAAQCPPASATYNSCTIGSAAATVGSPSCAVGSLSYSVIKTTDTPAVDTVVWGPTSFGIDPSLTTTGSTTSCYSSAAGVDPVADHGALVCPATQNLVMGQHTQNTTYACTYSTGAATGAACVGSTATSAFTNACYTSAATAQTAADQGTLTCPAGSTCTYAWNTPATACPVTTTSTAPTTACHFSAAAADAAADHGTLTCAAGHTCTYAAGAVASACAPTTTGPTVGSAVNTAAPSNSCYKGSGAGTWDSTTLDYGGQTCPATTVTVAGNTTTTTTYSCAYTGVKGAECTPSTNPKTYRFTINQAATPTVTTSTVTGNRYTVTKTDTGPSATLSTYTVTQTATPTVATNRYAVTQEVTPTYTLIHNAPASTSTTDLGLTSQCYSSLASCTAAEAASAACTGANISCVCSSATTAATIASCPAGTSQYQVVGNINSIVSTPTGTSTIPAADANHADEWAKFLLRTDVNSAAGQQNVKTYAIDVYKDAQDLNETALLRSMAYNGGGKYFAATDESAILNALRKIFSEIQSVNSVFASSSLPVSVNTQGTYLNQVFIGMFRPDSSGAPRWLGNLKQYEFAFFGSTLRLADKNVNEAISATTGFITPCAESFWSTDSGTYWDYPGSTARGSCTAVTSAFPAPGSSSLYSDLPDGEMVEKGGAAQRLRGVGSTDGANLITSSDFYATGRRNLQTCDNADCTSLIDFDTDNSATIGLSTAMIDWARGKDSDDEDGDIDLDEMRPSSHGDVVHSQPAAVDFGGSIGVYVFYGTNDGVFHAIRGDKLRDAASPFAEKGDERWGFIAPETVGRLARLRSNSPNVNIPGTAAPSSPKDYFFDGSVAAYQDVSTDPDTVWIYASMRRGGRTIYAFDMTDPTAPVLKWRRGCFTNLTTDDSSCSAGAWTAIGQTWSKPQIAKLSGYAGPVLVFGGGYDTCEDVNSQTRCAIPPLLQRKGANVWFVNADTGAIIRVYPTNYSVPGDVKLVTDANGNITQVYAADTGGYVYRINVGTYTADAGVGTVGTALGEWTTNATASDITIAYLSEANQARKLMNGLDVVEAPTYNAVALGSGDREHPLLGNYPCGTYSTTAGNFVTNQFFMIKDIPPGYPATPITASTASGWDGATGLTNVTNTPAATVYDVNSNGWKFNLNPCEQTVNKPTTIGGVVYFGTNQPTNTAVAACTTNLGTARGYSVLLLTGGYVPGATSRSTIFTGGGLPPSPVAGVVDVDGVKVPFILGATTAGATASASALEGGKVTINPSGTRARTYWYQRGK